MLSRSHATAKRCGRLFAELEDMTEENPTLINAKIASENSAKTGHEHHRNHRRRSRC